MAAGFIPTVDGEMVTGDDGIPHLLVAVIPRDEITFTDGWYVQGLKGTGSYDYNVTELSVPEEPDLSAVRPALRSAARAAAFRMGLIPITAAGHASWALGVAKSMLDDVTELAMTKVRMGDEASIAHRSTFQRGLSHHRSAWRAARLLVINTFTDVEARGERRRRPSRRPCGPTCGSPPPTPPSARRELASGPIWPPARRPSARGAASNGPSGTCTRARQHVFIGEKTYTDAAQIFLGLTEDQYGF